LIGQELLGDTAAVRNALRYLEGETCLELPKNALKERTPSVGIQCLLVKRVRADMGIHTRELFRTGPWRFLLECVRVFRRIRNLMHFNLLLHPVRNIAVVEIRAASSVPDSQYAYN
jgi:hypothetical protein